MYVLRIEIGYRRFARFEFADANTLVSVLELLTNSLSVDPESDDEVKLLAGYEPAAKKLVIE